jgi:membrane-bound lytic murein transglycosylase D
VQSASIFDATTLGREEIAAAIPLAHDARRKRFTMNKASDSWSEGSQARDKCARNYQVGNKDQWIDRRVQRLIKLPQWVPALACVPLVLLAGCPQQQAPSSTVPSIATAPAIAASTQPPTPAMTQAQSDQAAAKAARVRQLVGRVEATYNSGVNNYRGGHLEAARSDFDMAVDVMLTSGMDLKTDPQLSDEFDGLLNRINTLEMSALKQGTGFSAPVEAAPLDAADEVTFPPADAALTAKVTEEIKTTQSDFPLVVNDYVAGFINYFTNSKAGHATLLRSLERGGKYKDMISKVLRDEGVPQDLIYLAVMESGFQPQALNGKSGAGGMWQFMPTGAYGLARNGWVDERFDPEKSSRAYAKYIKSLYNQFGDWYLAMAAYDWGPGYVQRSVMRTGYADYWELYRRNALPQETKNYVPGIIAAIIMARNPKQYGLEDLVPDPPVVFDTVSVDYAVDLRLVADVTDVSVAEIITLNPSLLHMNTPRDTDFDLHVPMGTRDLYLRRIKDIPEEKRTSWRFHVVHPGESMDSIATMFHDRPAEINAANGLEASASINVGNELVIPVSPAIAMPHSLHYTTQAGDTLVTIADRFNVSVEDLRRWNHLSSSTIKPRRTLDVAQPIRLAPATHVRAKRSRAESTVARKTSAAPPSKASSTTPAHRFTPKKKAAANKSKASR